MSSSFVDNDENEINGPLENNNGECAAIFIVGEENDVYIKEEESEGVNYLSEDYHAIFLDDSGEANDCIVNFLQFDKSSVLFKDIHTASNGSKTKSSQTAQLLYPPPIAKFYKCAYCGFCTQKRSGMKRHIAKRHTRYVTVQGKASVVFDGIGSSSVYPTASKTSKNIIARDYMAKLRAKKKYPCPHCEYRAGTAMVLRNHIMAKHEKKKPLSCPHCDFTTVEYMNMKRHVQAKHTNVREHSCPYCKYRGLHGGNLKQHIMSKHTDDMLRCPECAYRSLHRGDLSRHVSVVHRKERKYTCPECDYRAGRPWHLKRHMIGRHGGERPLPCPHCDLRFIDKTDQKNHILARHNSNKWFHNETIDQAYFHT